MFWMGGGRIDHQQLGRTAPICSFEAVLSGCCWTISYRPAVVRKNLNLIVAVQLEKKINVQRFLYVQTMGFETDGFM
jgi:hypothetical protein